MKKLLVFLGLILVLLSSVCAIDVLNEDGNAQTYFSLSSDHVFVKSNINTSYLNVTYKIFNQSRYTTYVFEKCGDKYCVDFYLTDLVEADQGTIASGAVFKINQGQDSKTIYLDIEKPKFNIEDIQVDTENKKINVKYNFSDDSSKIDKINFYLEEDGDLEFIDEISDKTSTSVSIDETKTYTLVFKIEDIAGNSDEVKKDVKVNDIFKPKIEKAFLIKRDSGYQLEFKLSDANLTKYEIIQNSLTLSEDINNKKTYEKTVNIPFTSGNVVLKVSDGDGNTVSKTLSLKSPISHTYKNEYSSSRTFEFKSNANNCYIISVSGKSYGKNMHQSSNRFYYKLDIDTIKRYDVNYYCEYNNYREYFESEFYYDTNEPTKPEIEVKALDNGDIKIEWSESTDKETDVDYKLYRNGIVIYDGSKRKYEDIEVKYPKEYEYQVGAYDKAGNIEKSDEKSQTPLKVDVALSTSLSSDDTTFTDKNTYSFNVNSETDAKIDVVVKNNGQTIDRQTLTDIKDAKQNFNVKLQNGINSIEVTAVDKLGNTQTQSYFITYNQPQVEESKTAEVVPEPVIENKPQETQNTTVVADTSKEDSKYTWIWFVILLVVFVCFLWFFVFNEDARKKRSVASGSKNKKDKFNLQLDKLAKDKRLEKDFNRIKQNRIDRQTQREKEMERKKKLAQKESQKSELQKEKLKDLERKKEINIPLTTRAKAKASHKKIKKEPTYEEELQPTKQAEEKSKFSFFSRNKLHKKEDEMSDYIQKIKSTPSWDSPRDYVYQKPQEEPVKEEENNELKLGNNVEEEKKKKFGFFNRAPKSKEENIKQEEPPKEEVKPDLFDKKENINSFLDDIVKKKKRRKFFLAEKFVDKDINTRNE